MAILLTGCAAPSGNVTASDLAAEVPGAYRLRPGDVVVLEVFQEPYMTTRQRILDDGTISVGLIGRVRIAGETVARAAEIVAAKLDATQLVNPQVNISVESYSPRRFVVWGQVRAPGSYVIPAEEHLTLPQAIAMAGGNSDIGDPRRVTITRRDASGQSRRISINALSPEADQFYVREGDVIRVAETIF
ncbi:MAG: polysaccharide biosynthesis/export family protein [Terrimicrobiaceae bacterium]|nr:polysaccharide biosynthesis/export family protein [Terrimicrobiaceae bacterium]